MDNIKESFQRVKEDIVRLHTEMSFLKTELKETQEELIKLCEILKQLSQNLDKKQLPLPSIPPYPAHQHINPAEYRENPAHLTENTLKNTEKHIFSTGNEGVPTDRQTDQQTDTTLKNSSIKSEKTQETPLYNHPDSIEKAAKMIDSLDNLKKELRITFKRLTDQEVLVFSAIYQMDEENKYTDYKALSQKLNLTESSIRDYVGRLLKKNIPIEKKKINNKTIKLSISPNLKKIASLSTILQLRDL